jgi:hypothetical protein
MDWDDPVARYHLVERVGPAEYNRHIQQHFVDSTVSIVNGYRIRPVGSRFGRVFVIDGANRGYLKLEESEAYARTLPPGTEGATL